MLKFGYNFFVEFNEAGKVLKEEHSNHFISKFREDKIELETDTLIILLDGVILNKIELMSNSGKETWGKTMEYLYQSRGEQFFSELRGSFSGVLFDKSTNQILVFSDQIGSKYIYYYISDNKFYCSCMMDDLFAYLRSKGIEYHLSTEGAYLLLSYGYMMEGRTICQEIHKIKPGRYLSIKDGKIEEKQYYLIDNTPNNSLSFEDFIEGVDYEFRKAIQQQFDKDKEYGYKHIVALSAGLDSRMTAWVAHDMGYTDQLNYTFSQSDYYDEFIPKRIARDLKHEWVFKSLDNGIWLYNIEDITRVTGGNVLYYGLSHSYSMYSLLNFEKYGMIHTGQLGDVIIGTFYHSTDKNAQYRFGDGAYSQSMLDRICDLDYTRYANEEVSKLYIRGFDGANNGNISEYLFNESFSPFYNLDFIKFALSVPVEMRFNHKLYKEWIIKKYPYAANYKWERIGCKITRKLGLINISGNSVPIESIPGRVINKIKGRYGKFNEKNMNPIGYYLSCNQQLNSFLSSYVCYIDSIEDKQLKNDVLQLIESNNPMERIQVVSLLACIKLYFTK